MFPSPHSHPACPTPRVLVVQSKSRYELKDEDKHEALDQEFTILDHLSRILGSNPPPKNFPCAVVS